MPKEPGESQRIRYRKMYSCLTKQGMLFLLSTPKYQGHNQPAGLHSTKELPKYPESVKGI